MAPKILLVDDDESVRITLAANLELEGIDVVEAENASAALALVQQQRFDLVLSDVRMPGMGGVELFLAVKRVAPELPVLLMTGFTSEDAVTRAVAAGVFAVLIKPFDIRHAVKTLQRALRRPVVLIVDDAEASVTATAAALRAVGLRVEAAFDGPSALRIVARGNVDVCFTDLAMPGMSGVELTRRIRQFDPNVCVIVFAGGDNQDDMIRQAARSGARHCLRKPLDMNELLANIVGVRGRP